MLFGTTGRKQGDLDRLEVGTGGRQTTRVQMLERLIRSANEPSNEIWLAPVGTVADYVISKRGAR